MLNATFLIASAINADGKVELPAVQDGVPIALVRAYFSIAAGGRLVQQVMPRALAPGSSRRDEAPLDMTFFARCLCRRFGELTPDIFTLRGFAATGGFKGNLLLTDAASEDARQRALRNAFLVHLTAYEERLI